MQPIMHLPVSNAGGWGVEVRDRRATYNFFVQLCCKLGQF